MEAFLYLENCTQYQLKRIRKHVMEHGVTPRVHGNHGKRPHNRFSLDIYQHATAFLQGYIQRQSSINTVSSSSSSHRSKARDRGHIVYLPADVTRKTVHLAYTEYMEHFEPGTKLLGYSTFRHFMKLQFPHVKFAEVNNKNAPPPPLPSSSSSADAHSAMDCASSRLLHLSPNLIQISVIEDPVAFAQSCLAATTS